MRRRLAFIPDSKGFLGVGAVVAVLATQGARTGPAEAPSFPPAATVSVEAPATDPDVERLAALVEQAEQRAGHAAERVFATVDGLDLALPGRTVLEVGFHETGSEFGMLGLEPGGVATANHNRARVAAPAPSVGPDYLILPSRDRDGHATSAADIMLRRGEDVLAPVSGTVVAVHDYLLYDEHPDRIIEVRPAARPDLLVAVFHVDGVVVRPGDEVVAGQTVIADSARVFPFVSSIESVTGVYEPHVDVRVRAA